jgi:hypothetical protein
MESIVIHPGRTASGFTVRERAERLAAASPERRRLALVFLSGYAPGVFDVVLDAVEPCADEDGADEDGAGEEPEPFCGFCGERLGIFVQAGPDWLHYRGENPGGPFQVFDPGHDPVITWRIAAGIAVAS